MIRTLFCETAAYADPKEFIGWIEGVTKIVPEDRKHTIKIGSQVGQGGQGDGPISYVTVTYDDGREDPEVVCRREGHEYKIISSCIERTSFRAASSKVPLFCIAVNLKIDKLHCIRCGYQEYKAQLATND